MNFDALSREVTSTLFEVERAETADDARNIIAQAQVWATLALAEAIREAILIPTGRSN